jgi:dTDP-4-dehydrorhamnose reductase
LVDRDGHTFDFTTAMKKLLVTGASGLLGWNVCAIARESWRVFGVVNRHAIDLPGASRLICDLTRPDHLLQLFRNVAADAVVHCAAVAQPDACQAQPEDSRPINVEVPATLAQLCAAARTPYVFVSTDLVFDGTRAPYDEGDPVSPVSVYGEQKVAAERMVRERHPDAMIVRLPLMFGDPGPAATSFIHPWVAALRSGKVLSLFVDEFRTPVGVRTAARGLLMAPGLEGGILHLGGRERVSRYDLGVLLAEMLGAEIGLIQPGRQRDRTVGAPRPPDVSLNSARAYALGYDPPSLSDALAEFLRDLPASKRM